MKLTEKEMSEVYEDFCKCSDVAMMAASYWAEACGSWTGTVSERLRFVFSLEHEARLRAEAKLAQMEAEEAKEKDK